jgi:hypothetical protein
MNDFDAGAAGEIAGVECQPKGYFRLSRLQGQRRRPG